MGIFDIFRAARDVENVRLHLHFVHPAYEAARAVVEDARLHWWDRDDGTVDVSGKGSNEVGLRAFEAAQAVIPAERARVQALPEGTARTSLLARLDRLEAQDPPDPWIPPSDA